MSDPASSINATTPDVPQYDDPMQLMHDSVNLMSETTVVGVMYGMMLTLYGITAYFLVKSRKDRARNTFYIAYTTIMAILGTVYLTTSARDADLSYVMHRLFPGGPLAYSNVIYSSPNTIVGSCSWVAINLMADGLLVWRVFILYQASPGFQWVVAFPFITYIASIAMGVVMLVQSLTPNSSLFSENTINMALPFFCLSVSLTFLATAMLTGRILYHRYKFRKQFGNHSSSLEYTSIAAMLIESAALYSAFGLIFISLYAIGHPVVYIFLASLAQVQIIAPLLIILRVSLGKAWNSRTQTEVVSTLELAHTSTISTRVGGGHASQDALKISVQQDVSHGDVEKLDYTPKNRKVSVGLAM